MCLDVQGLLSESLEAVNSLKWPSFVLDEIGLLPRNHSDLISCYQYWWLGMENKPSVLTRKYEIGRLIGQGTFAKVYFARSIGTSQSVAIKMIDKEKIFKSGLIEQLKREISVMRIVRHPNIVQLYEVMATKSKIYFIMEYAKGGELFHKVSKGKLKDDAARKYFQQLINAVDFCHSRGVYHRDIKPENLLLDENENLKVTDFGLSALSDTKHQDGLLHTTCGTPAYVAPEVINRKGYDGAKADIWSCGVVLYVLLAGYLPFHDANLMALYRKIGKAEFKCPSWFTLDARKLLVRILDPKPETRMSIARIRESPWFRKGSNSKQVKTETETETRISSSSSLERSRSGPSRNSSIPLEEEDEQSNTPATLNAFDIISLSSGFDLSGLFEGIAQKKEARFTSLQPATTIISTLEDIANRLRLKLMKREEGLLKLEGTTEGRKGPLLIDAEIFEVTPTLHFVEVRKSSGDTIEYQKILNEELRPALHDIAWAWPDEVDQTMQQQQQPEEPQQETRQKGVEQ